ncbi:NAD(P)/FAD-dependent oxidoreductase [Salisaeta longa]|uniref:NAD(P)/FAD-dependent oxidoreductase n=1 Tax=Salisaeta longa TaxID=503170 RepID=UPI0003B4A1E8|nr:FAD-dependent oxidoreductase [Salisaeta longa]
MKTDFIVVGAGIAGACAAFELSRKGTVRVLEAQTPAAGASGAAAGLVNPLMGRKANPTWRLHEALAATRSLIARAAAEHTFSDDGVLRPTVEPAQVDFFKERHDEFPELTAWLSEAEVAARFPDVQTCGGALFIPQGGAVDVPSFVRCLLQAAQQRGADVLTHTPMTSWTADATGATVTVGTSDGPATYRARHVVLCLGQGYPGHPALEALDLEGIKGQTVRMARPAATGTGPLVPMSGRGYLVPNGDTLIAGSSYTHTFDSLAPDPENTRYILEKTNQMLPGVAGAAPQSVTTGVRVKHRSSNLPLVGPLPETNERVWTLTALGSKGLLTAPLLARALPTYIHDPATIPSDVRLPTNR